MKNLLYDLLNGFTVHDFTMLFLQLFAALFIGQWLRLVIRLSNRNIVTDTARFVILPLIMALLVVLSKNSAPLSISALGVFILAAPFSKQDTSFDKGLLFLLGGAGFGCGAGYVLVTLLVYLLIVSPVLYWMAKKN